MKIEIYKKPPEIFCAFATPRICGHVSITPSRWKFRFDTYWDNSKWLSIGPLHFAWARKSDGQNVCSTFLWETDIRTQELLDNQAFSWYNGVVGERKGNG